MLKFHNKRFLLAVHPLVLFPDFRGRANRMQRSIATSCNRQCRNDNDYRSTQISLVQFYA